MDETQVMQQQQAGQTELAWSERVQEVQGFEREALRLQDEQGVKDTDELSELLEAKDFEMIVHVPITYLSYDKKSKAQYRKDYQAAKKLAKDRQVTVTGHTVRLLSSSDDRIEEQDIDRLILSSEAEEIKDLKKDRTKRDRVKKFLALDLKKSDADESGEAALKEAALDIDKREYALVKEYVVKPFRTGDGSFFADSFTERAVLKDPAAARKKLDTLKLVSGIALRMKETDDPVRKLALKDLDMTDFWGHNKLDEVSYAIEIFERNARLCEEAYRAILWGHGVMLDEQTGKPALRDESTRYDKVLDETIMLRPVDRVLAELGSLDRDSVEFRVADEYFTAMVIKEGDSVVNGNTRGEDDKLRIDGYIGEHAGSEQYKKNEQGVSALVADYKKLTDDEKITRRKTILSKMRLMPWERNEDVTLIYERVLKGYEVKKAALDHAIRHLVQGEALETKYLPYLAGYDFIDAVDEKEKADAYFDKCRQDCLVIDSSAQQAFDKQKEAHPYVNVFGGSYAVGIGSMLHDFPELTELQKGENEATIKYFELAGRILEHKAAGRTGIPKEVNTDELNAARDRVFVKETGRVREFLRGFAYRTAPDGLLMEHVGEITKMYYSLRVMHRMHDRLKAVSEQGASLLDSKEKEILAFSFEKVMEGLYRKTRGVTIKQVSGRFGYDESMLTEEEKSSISRYHEDVRTKLVINFADNLVLQGDEAIGSYDVSGLTEPGYTDEEREKLEKRLFRAKRDISLSKARSGANVVKHFEDKLSVVKSAGIYSDAEKEEAVQRAGLGVAVYYLENDSEDYKLSVFRERITTDTVALREHIGNVIEDEQFEVLINDLTAYKKDKTEESKSKTLDASKTLLNSLAAHYLELGEKYGILKRDYKRERKVEEPTIKDILGEPYDYLSFLRRDILSAFDPNALYDTEDAEEHYYLFCDMCKAAGREIDDQPQLDIVVFVAFALMQYADAQRKAWDMTGGGADGSYDEAARNALRAELSRDKHIEKLQIRNAQTSVGI